MKKLLAIMLSAVMVLGLCVFTVSAEATSIGTWDELVAWATGSDTSSDVTLTADITAPTDATWSAKSDFSGTFDGAGHSISGLKGSQGLFYKVTGATIKDLSIVDSTFNGSSLAAFAYYAAGDVKFVNCYTNATVYGDNNNVGGFVASTNGAATVTFEGCWFDGDVTSDLRYISGFLANNQSKPATFTDCLSTGNVTCNGDSTQEPIVAFFAGAGYSGKCTFTNCLVSDGVVTIGTDSWKESKGGAFGYRNNGGDEFTNCYALTGCANRLTSENSGGADSVTGQAEWIEASAITAEKMGAGWGENAEGKVVPAAFAAASNSVTIGTWDELVAFAAATGDDDVTYTLIADITAPSDATWTPKANFAGTFDGAGHSITGLKGAQGLCTKVTGATFKNLYIIDAEISATAAVGSIAGTAAGATTVKNVYSNAKISSTTNNIGGIIGHGTFQNTDPTTFESCWFDGEIKLPASGRYASGILGNQESSVVVCTDCLNTGSVSGAKNLAGISNAIYSGKLDATRCVNAGLITASDANAPGSAIADTVGENNKSLGAYAKMTACYAVKDMQGSAGVRDLRATNTDAAVEGEVLIVDDLAAIANIATLADTWAANPNGLMVPKYFAAKELGPEVATTPETPSVEGDIVITTWDELVAWAADSDTNEGKVVAIGADITAPTDATWAAGKAEFAGTLDGNGFTISGINATAPLIVKANGATIKSLNIVDSTFTGESMSAYVYNGTGHVLFQDCYTNATVKGTNNNVAAFVATGTWIQGQPQESESFTFEGCWFDGDVTTDARYISGFIANNQSQNVDFVDCLSTGNVGTTDTEGEPIIAFFAGAGYQGHMNFTNCLVSAGTVTVAANWEGSKGAAFAFRSQKNDDTFANCYAVKDSAVQLWHESEAGKSNMDGKVEWIDSASAATAEKMGKGWGVNGEGKVVPLAFATPIEADLTITTWDELVAFGADSSDFADKYVVLGNDITAPADATWTPKTAFAGTFDGQGYTISGLKASGESGLGFIKTLSGTVKNLYIKDSTFTATASGIGSVAAYASGEVTIENVYSNATISGLNSMGGIVGDAAGALTQITITSCWFDGTITASGSYASGIFGNQESKPAVITDCLNTGAISVKKDQNTSGISTAVYDGSLIATRCVNLGPVTTGTTEEPGKAGCAILQTVTSRNGLVGEATIDTCFNLKDAALSQPWDIRDSAKLTGTVTEVESLDDLSVFADLGEGWVVITHNDQKIVVPEYFADETAEDIPAPTEPTVEPKTISVTAGDQAEVQEDADYTLTLEGDIADLKVAVDNKELAADQFSVAGQNVTIKAAALSNLFYGAHRVTFTAGEATATASFTLVAAPETSDDVPSSSEAPSSSEVPSSSEPAGTEGLDIVEDNVTAEEGKDLELTVTGELPEGFTVTVDGQELTSDDYTVADGKITLKAAFLATLKDGEHAIRIGTADNGADAKFNTGAAASEPASQPASASTAPITADGITIFMVVALILSAGAFVIVSKARNRA